ncbi:alcohol dehydrogenase catalytic domain-containing protein [Mesorhizobium muleiense]|uniref:zinc-dependent alcohol dehydrogenase n=1 Tax=Mesorhizobium muleiense TaxID=1004279 RepID=UPI001F3BE362|nr:alcohol dehydrogenase catalytic domain-containing protein [Mesorhizobium muleiense]MCF6118139.1 alcohol dehydrogenase catalytic domain-containing protein [Mesorhizobium muleiense]
MKAARLHAAGDLRVEDVPSPGEPAPGWVRLKVTAAGICGSDLHNFRTGQWISRAPSVVGHEFAGEVTAVGAGVSQVALGDRVVADSRFWCGECPACRAGLHNVCATLGFVGEVCDGGFAEETQLPARLLLRHDPALDPAIAAMAEPLAVALHAVRRLSAPAGAPVLIAGCGPIGGLAALLLSRRSERPVLVADRNAARADLVAEVSGATVVDLDALPCDPNLRHAPDLRHAIDATGSVAVMARLLDVLAGGGTLALVGISHGRLDLDPNLLVEREIALVGCHAFADELAPAVSMLGDLAPALSRFVSDEIAIGEIPAAYQRLIAGVSGGLKTIVRMESGR